MCCIFRKFVYTTTCYYFIILHIIHMNKLFSVLCVLWLLFTSFANVTFAQYGGGSRGGSSSSSLVKDNCPDGDTSWSYYDGTCGDGEEMMEETEEEMMDDDSDSDLLESIDNNTDEDDMMEEEAEEEMMDDDMDEGTWSIER